MTFMRKTSIKKSIRRHQQVNYDDVLAFKHMDINDWLLNHATSDESNAWHKRFFLI